MRIFVIHQREETYFIHTQLPTTCNGIENSEATPKLSRKKFWDGLVMSALGKE
jgi:hypothetical protein